MSWRPLASSYAALRSALPQRGVLYRGLPHRLISTTTPQYATKQTANAIGSRSPGIKFIEQTAKVTSSKAASKDARNRLHKKQVGKASQSPTSAQSSRSDGLPVLTSYEPQSYRTTHLNRGTPTIIFTAPSHTSFNVASQFQAGFCLVYALNTFQTMYLFPPPGLAPIVPQMFLAVSFTMLVFTGYLSYGPSRMVSRILSTPAVIDDKGKVVALAGHDGLKAEDSIKGKTEIRIVVEKRKYRPLWWGRTEQLILKPEEVELIKPVGLKDLGRYPTKADERLQAWLAKRDEKRQAIGMQTGIRRAWSNTKQNFTNFCQDFGRVWTKNGLEEIAVKGRTLPLKLDMRDGTALRKGHIMDRIFFVRSNMVR